MEYRKHLQAFIDRWRYNANRGLSQSLFYCFDFENDAGISAPQAQSRIKVLEKVNYLLACGRIYVLTYAS